MNLHGHIIVTQSPEFTLGVTLGVVHSLGLEKCISCASTIRVSNLVGFFYFNFLLKKNYLAHAEWRMGS